MRLLTMQDVKPTGQNRIQAFAFVLSVGAAVGLACGFIPSVRGSQPASRPDKIHLEDRINPNEAPVGSLVRLPGLGIGRAGAIVAYRQEFRRDSKRPAFQNCNDLQKVHGIGPKTVQNMKEWLRFE
jgi:competence ComEA-like helix-hairpin-helix protein